VLHRETGKPRHILHQLYLSNNEHDSSWQLEKCCKQAAHASCERRRERKNMQLIRENTFYQLGIRSQLRLFKQQQQQQQYVQQFDANTMMI